MNQLETNLALWAICSIILFEILIIICLCRCCFNRIKPKKFYVKREEYEYLQDINNGTQSKFQSVILRPPAHADELAHVGTIREGQNPLLTYNDGFQNLGFYHDDDDENQRIQSSQNWIELQPTIINTAQLPPADYEIHSYPNDTYLHPQPLPPRAIINDYHQYQEDDSDEIENFHFHSLRRPEIILPQQIQRKDTSTESYNINYLNIIPKSILKTVTNTPPPPSLDLLSTTYFQTQRSRTPSNYDESPRISVKINTDQTIPIDYPINIIEKQIPIEPMLTLPKPLSSKHRMKFASVSQLNDIEWEVPSEFRTILQHNQTFNSNRQRTPSTYNDSNIHISWKNQSKYLSNDDITQQQAFEY